MARRAAPTLLALFLGSLAAVHPFARITDPAVDTFDKVICPVYWLAPLVANRPQWRDAPFFSIAILSNALLYSLIAWKVTGVFQRRC